MSVWQTGSGRVAIRGSDVSAAGAGAPSADAAFKIALDLHHAGRVSNAVASAGQTLQRFPDHVPTLHLLAQIMRRLGHAATAFETLAKAISIAPDNFSLYNDAGLALSALGHHNEATAYFTGAIELKPAAHAQL
ncbi:MAG: tetratricopeptide repeat protein [Rhodospirillaceae bacterium]|jgi:Tfp pilus assembly protein PilF|nr:tetratricopeptide repeat protein [Rhodospirillaceae bacterium]